MDDLKKQAEELGIKVDGRWSEERLREEIDKALAGPADSDGGTHGSSMNNPQPFGGKGDHDGDGKAGGSVTAPERLIPVSIVRDIWDGDGNRHRKGKIIGVDVDSALSGVESGAIKRVKE